MQDKVEFWDARVAEAVKAGKGLRAAISDCGSDLHYWARIDTQSRDIIDQHIQPGESVLDVGCGLGDLKGLLPPGCTYTGLDIYPPFIQAASLLWPGSKFVVGNYRDLSMFPDNSFDYVICRGTLGAPDTEILRVARKGALIMEFTDPIVAYIHKWGDQ